MYRFLPATAVALAFSFPVSAATVYSNQGLFDAATENGAVLDDYNDLSFKFFAPNEVTDRGSYSITNLEGTTGFVTNNGTGGTPTVVMGFSSSAASLQYDLDVAASAIFFDVKSAGTSQTYNISAGGETVSISFGNSTEFRGVVFNSLISSFTITDTDRTGNGYFDNFGVASSSMPAVPLPASGLFLLAGLGGLSTLRRQR